MEFSPASVVADAAENLSGDPLLHMVHTKVNAWRVVQGHMWQAVVLAN